MTREQSIIELGDWLATPPGRCLLHWEQQVLDHALADVFGFHALQVGMPEMDGLRTNRMPNRWIAGEVSFQDGWPDLTLPEPEGATRSPPLGPGLACVPEALPFPDQSLDLVLLPHTLELALDPHQALAEAARVLRPQGRVVITGFNPVSLWALRQRAGHVRRSLGLGAAPLYLPRAGEFLGYWRVRDWLRLLSLEPERARFGCYRPPCRTEAWLARWQGMEAVGERWWPVLGAVYMVQAVKTVRGMRLIGLSPARGQRVRAAAPAVAANRGPIARQSAGHSGDNATHD